MTTTAAARLAAYAVLLAVVFALAFAVGSTLQG